MHTVLKPTSLSAGTAHVALEQWLLMENQYRLRVFEIRVLRRIFRPDRE
jgi:hypothetical protein